MWGESTLTVSSRELSPSPLRIAHLARSADAWARARRTSLSAFVLVQSSLVRSSMYCAQAVVVVRWQVGEGARTVMVEVLYVWKEKGEKGKRARFDPLSTTTKEF